MEERDAETTSLFNIPYSDVIFAYIFTKLTPQELFSLRVVSKQMNKLVKDYFKSSKTLDLSRISRTVTRDAFEIFTKDAHNLRYVNLCGCKCLDSRVLDPVLQDNDKIYSLNISNCFSVSNSSLQCLGPELRVLNLSNCHWVSAEALETIAVKCKNLESLDLTSCWEVTDEAVCSVVFNLSSRLKNLSVSRIYGITDVSLVLISHTCTCLETLNLAGCWRITDYGIKLIGEYCHNLKWLQVEDCRSVTEFSLILLRSKISIDRPATNPCILLPRMDRPFDNI